MSEPDEPIVVMVVVEGYAELTSYALDPKAAARLIGNQ
jgi:hypothetical protein